MEASAIQKARRVPFNRRRPLDNGCCLLSSRRPSSHCMYHTSARIRDTRPGYAIACTALQCESGELRRTGFFNNGNTHAREKEDEEEEEEEEEEEKAREREREGRRESGTHFHIPVTSVVFIKPSAAHGYIDGHYEVISRRARFYCAIERE